METKISRILLKNSWQVEQSVDSTVKINQSGGKAAPATPEEDCYRKSYRFSLFCLVFLCSPTTQSLEEAGLTADFVLSVLCVGATVVYCVKMERENGNI